MRERITPIEYAILIVALSGLTFILVLMYLVAPKDMTQINTAPPRSVVIPCPADPELPAMPFVGPTWHDL